jgi:hypothetical protein
MLSPNSQSSIWYERSPSAKPIPHDSRSAPGRSISGTYPTTKNQLPLIAFDTKRWSHHEVSV